MRRANCKQQKLAQPARTGPNPLATRSANDPLAGLGLAPGNPFGGVPGQFAARPLQSSPQDIYYFTKRSLSGSDSSGPLLARLQELLERVARAIDNADKRYN